FALLEPFLRRDPKFSTEILLTMNMPVMHRLAGYHAVKGGHQENPVIKTYHHTLTRIFGGAAVAEHPGETRKSMWFKIVQGHFMRYLETEYRATVQRLVDENKLTSPTSRKTKRLNDNCILHLS